MYHNSEHSLGHQRLHLSEVTSTNDLARQMLEENLAGHGTFIRADWQQHGRGQEKSTWDAEKGKNLLCSLIITPDGLKADSQVYLNITIALAVHDMIKHFLPEEHVAIKWPNDIYVNDRKIAGILIENSLQGMYIRNVIAGIGININQEHFVNPKAISLIQAKCRLHDLSDCTDVLLERINNRYEQLKSGLRLQLWDDYHAVLYKKGISAVFETKEGTISGTVKGIDAAGRLILQTGDKESVFHVKEIQWR